MAILLVDSPVSTTINPKSRLRRPLLRHTSMPARSPSTHESSDTSQWTYDTRSPSPQTSTIDPVTKYTLQHELYLAQSQTVRLRRERNTYRSLALKQEADLDALQHKLKNQYLTTHAADLNNANLRLHQELDSTRYQALLAKHDALVNQLNDAQRTIARLKKSDRAKGKVQQQNLRLKTTLRRVSMQNFSSTQVNSNMEDTLREALAVACERVEELEDRGGRFLNALEERDEEGGGEEGKSAELVEAEVAFRGVLEDEGFAVEKENWGELLRE